MEREETRGRRGKRAVERRLIMKLTVLSVCNRVPSRSNKSFSRTEKNNGFGRCTTIAIAIFLRRGVHFSQRSNATRESKRRSSPRRAKWLPPFQELSRCRKSLARQKNERRTEKRRKREEEEGRRKVRVCGGAQRQRRRWRPKV